MFARVIATALVAGALAGLFIFAAHMLKTAPLIIQAEVYENPAPPANQKHSHSEKSKTDHDHSKTQEWAPDDGLERSFYTLVSDLITSIGFAFLLVGAIALRGRELDWQTGMIWGLCGYAAVFVGPAFGLAPELPGMQAADLQSRQIWWLATAAATASALALLFFTDRAVLKAGALLLLILPHLIGAPAHDLHPGRVPAELAAEFAIATLVVSGLFWLLLGGLAGHFYGRFNWSNRNHAH